MTILAEQAVDLPIAPGGLVIRRWSGRPFMPARFKRIWPPLMIGTMFVLEVAWILFIIQLPRRWAHAILGP